MEGGREGGEGGEGGLMKGTSEEGTGRVIFVCTSIVDITINRRNLAPPTLPDVLVTGR